MKFGLFYQIQVPKPWTTDSESRRLDEALGIEEIFPLCAIGPAQHTEVLHTIRLLGQEVIPHFRAKERRATPATAASAAH